MAGPTPRSKDVPSWRPEAIELLQKLGFGGVIYVPEYIGCDAQKAQEDAGKDWYAKQVEWEHKGLNRANAILMWVPRELKDMPAMTTNTEFGLYVCENDDMSESRLFYGRPDLAPKCEYMDYCYKKFTGRKPKSTLYDLVVECLEAIS